MSTFPATLSIVLVARDCGDLQIASAQANHEVGGVRHFDGRLKIIGRRALFDADVGLRAVGGQLGPGLAGIAAERDADVLAGGGTHWRTSSPSSST